MTKNWEQEAKALEEIDVAALADDEKAALWNGIKRTLTDMMPAVLQGECSMKLAKRIERAVGQADQADDPHEGRLPRAVIPSRLLCTGSGMGRAEAFAMRLCLLPF